MRDALIALHAEQEARAKDQHANYEPIYAPSVLIQSALLVVGFCARSCETAVGRDQDKFRLTEETLIADKRAFIFPSFSIRLLAILETL